MAVIQISKIQVRRGREETAGVPQLAGGEFGWAVDTQNLYIGNGSVAEGAPAVGNTKILTENDDLLSYVAAYTYKREAPYIQTGDSPGYPVERTLQDRLDDQVSVLNFGAEVTGSTDQTEALQRAIDQLYLNEAIARETDSRVILDIPAGYYKISEPLRIPPHAHLRGAGRNSTIIEQQGDFPVAVTVPDNSTPGNYKTLAEIVDIYQPRNIKIEGIHFKNLSNNSGITLNATKDTIITNCKFTGSWVDADGSSENYDSGLSLYSVSSLVTCENVTIRDCDFKNFARGIDSSHDIAYITIENNTFEQHYKGIAFGDDTGVPGVTTGPKHVKIIGNRFDYIERQGVDVSIGYSNTTMNNVFKRVGYDNANPALVQTSVIKFNANDNVSYNDSFQRTYDLSVDLLNYGSIPYYPEVEGLGLAINPRVMTVSAGSSVISAIFRLPGAETASYNIHYIYKSITADVVRRGTLELIVNRITKDDAVAYPNSPLNLTCIESYNITGLAVNYGNLTLSARLTDTNDSASDPIATVEIRAVNTTVNDQGNISFYFEKLS